MEQIPASISNVYFVVPLRSNSARRVNPSSQLVPSSRLCNRHGPQTDFQQPHARDA